MELSVQSVKTQHQKELDGREEDMEQLKATMNKKLKTMEQQLEEEHESKQQALKVMHTERESECVKQFILLLCLANNTSSHLMCLM